MIVGTLLGLMMGFWLSKAVAQAPIGTSTIINPPYGPPRPPNPSPKRTISSNKNNGQHSSRSQKQISAEAIRVYLVSKGSPLADYAEQISNSPYSSTIIGICAIEESTHKNGKICDINPRGSNNFWGIMERGGLKTYPAIGQGIEAINNFLGRAETGHRATIESFRGWYCASACTNWESTVLKIKAEVENL